MNGTLKSSKPVDSHKKHVGRACLHCKKGHLACDISRPCRKCVNVGKGDSCIDVEHKPRGRPKTIVAPVLESATTEISKSATTETSESHEICRKECLVDEDQAEERAAPTSDVQKSLTSESKCNHQLHS